MDDKELVRLFWDRNETALAECGQRYGSWLRAQKKDDRVLFVRRYYYGETVQSLAAAYGCSEQKMAQIMLRLRRSLKKAIEKTEAV